MGYDKEYKEMTQSEVTQVTMSKVYAWMALALVVSGITALYTVGNETLLNLVLGNSFTIWGLMLAELGLVIYLSARLDKISFTTGALLFGVYSVLNGITLSLILLVYTMSSIYTAFFTTSLTFAAMSIYGYTTKKDLSSLGSYLLMALIGLIIATLVNLFLKNGVMDLIITYVGIFIFVGLTAYDTQKIKTALEYGGSYGVDTRKIALMGALSLYLDFINLFLYILRLLGRRE